ncbi:MAG: OsmC family protein [Chloroflexota bacterium]|nr:OsmC family protein [Chloroflexota bacterium]
MDVITTHHKGDMLFETQLGSHVLEIDVPDTMGGKDRGPQPPELFVASLGSCVAALVANYCNKSGLSTDGLTVDVTYEKASDPTRLIDLKVKVDLPNADISGREKAIQRVADHCPVHQTICTLEGVDIEVSGKAT